MKATIAVPLHGCRQPSAGERRTTGWAQGRRGSLKEPSRLVVSFDLIQRSATVEVDQIDVEPLD